MMKTAAEMFKKLPAMASETFEALKPMLFQTVKQTKEVVKHPLVVGLVSSYATYALGNNGAKDVSEEIERYDTLTTALEKENTKLKDDARNLKFKNQELEFEIKTEKFEIKREVRYFKNKLNACQKTMEQTHCSFFTGKHHPSYECHLFEKDTLEKTNDSENKNNITMNKT